MSNQVQFQSFNFNSNAVRVITDTTGEFWFCGKDVCTILGYVNESLTLQKHCKENGVSKRYLIDKMQRKQEAVFINEPNLYRLIIKSRKPEAEKFEAWVFEEVLPQIRKTGKYSLQHSQQIAPLALPEPKFTLELTESELKKMINVWMLFTRFAESVEFLLKKIKPIIISDIFNSVELNLNWTKKAIKDTLPLIDKLLEVQNKNKTQHSNQKRRLQRYKIL